MSERVIEGIGATPRTGVGSVVWYRPAETGDESGEPVPEAEREAERDRFETARERAHEELDAERERTAERVGEEEAAVFDAHRQFLDDPQIETGVTEAIEGGTPAAGAVREAFEGPIAQFEGMDGQTAERADDLRDVRDRLVRLLTGGERVDLAELPEGSILLAERLTPSDTAQLDPERVAGFATATGGRTSHAAIFARSLAIPAVLGVGSDLESIEEGERIVVDGEEGIVAADPTDERVADARAGPEEAAIRERVATSDGRKIEVAANVGRAADLEGAVSQGADGIGLYRTEFLFLDREEPPAEDEQYERYVEALEAFPEGRVVVRTLDIGGDKQIPYLDLPAEENPFLGERGIRRSLGSDRELFETQLRALLRAGAVAGGDLAVMFPLVSTVEELDRALDRVEAVADSLASEGLEYAIPELGVMIETPGAVFVAEELASRVDFLSIGTNDLAQYVMAAARENERVADLHDPLHPPVLRAIRRSIEAAHDNDAWIGMCGEMAGDPDLTELLIGLGLDELSMSAVTIPAVKANVGAVETDRANDLAERALATTTRADVTNLLTDP
ncbi:phosphoenolpyruvate--protein phosphotransferase [Halalkalicoccus jeotgali]|uniref:Phosphoenolpyruvate-protein phosphotransferase n=1 Tax=Halalkalicoccus jeotgali (strain DSM 18796 / CECT 7217 / JCM 14584 / KCTC 4019 / B3) TaxID=795797 RepID=D8J423_HALJB|nr:phosphoenolpyruvate--protein phosphotransferase [Halalkalicoccus jeotgali]ADJ15415.1 phosphoenolpyruvate-protein phosphotransferase [Halalkalicoccus jeotgali B3]ELY35809.1 phosphoenolpyruvate-protein phosphotransferase [Halalkalicoccus jeotgali B3]